MARTFYVRMGEDFNRVQPFYVRGITMFRCIFNSTLACLIIPSSMGLAAFLLFLTSRFICLLFAILLCVMGFIFMGYCWFYLSERGVLHAKEEPFPEVFRDLAQKMKFKPRRFKTTQIKTAALTAWNDLIMCSDWLTALSEDEQKAIVAHEFAHGLLRGYLLTSLFLISLVSFIPVSPLLEGSSLFVQLPRVISYALILIPLLFFVTSWLLELSADRRAAKEISTNSMINALLSISNPKTRDKHSLTHPSINFRIKLLRQKISSKP